jgi:LacI family transcriptional regulator
MRLERIGQRAVELLLAMVDGADVSGVERVAPRLIVRESTLGDG